MAQEFEILKEGKGLKGSVIVMMREPDLIEDHSAENDRDFPPMIAYLGLDAKSALDFAEALVKIAGQLMKEETR